ncbi:putative ribonuclease H-like domain-containing protein [Tanacetum coccineum]
MKDNDSLVDNTNKVSIDLVQSECNFGNNEEDIENYVQKDNVNDTRAEARKDDDKSENKNVSYVNMVKKDAVSKNLNYIPTMVTNIGSEVVIFNEMLVKKGSERWSLTVYGKFMGDSKRMNVVLDKGPWMVKIVNVPLEARSMHGISALASSLGSLLKWKQIRRLKRKLKYNIEIRTKILKEVKRQCKQEGVGSSGNEESLNSSNDNGRMDGPELYRKKRVFNAKMQGPRKTINNGNNAGKLKDMVKYFKEKWEEDRQKEINVVNEETEGEDVINLSKGSTKIRGENEINGEKQKEVMNLVVSEKLQVCAIPETRLKGTTSITLIARLPILNPGEYDLWLMRIEQYFLMTDYSLWEDKRNEMKARGTLLMELTNKDQLKFHSYKDAKLLMEAIEKRYGGNKESKKVQRTLLKQQYENFARSSSETMDQTIDRLQKLISQLEIQGEVITQEDMNLTLTNSNSSINEADNTAYGVSAAHTQSNPTFRDNLSDSVICAFLAIRARGFIKRTCRKLDVNGQRVGFNMSKVECYNCHKNGHFARECRAPRNQENRGRENSRRTVTVETPTENALDCSRMKLEVYAELPTE